MHWTQDSSKSESITRLMKPQGAPRGLLVHYILHRIAASPSHGYEILQDIEEKTKGGWRPGPGSTYPILRRLEDEGLIKADSSTHAVARRTYHITSAGIIQLKAARKMFAGYGEKLQSLRGLIAELIDPEHMENFLVEGSKNHFQLTQDIFKHNMKNLPHADLDYILKEYTLNLERQLSWAKQTSRVVNTRSRGARK
ncbi:MAG TPA: PadR family transcriptional regulator [Nitrososphaeraceae archaeon]|nr:PadR family transcriptional regulator [Nitrososphaeraceae archaeon]